MPVALLNNLIMSHSSNQKKQKILNYEIRLMQECPDSLFNSSKCSHDRYLEWGLGRTIRSVIGDTGHRLRWMGSEPNSPLYSFIYIAMTACTQESSLMVQLKSALYVLAEKYLALFEQKLLIEFLYLLEYSQEKHLFFRKYAAIERIFLRLFAELQRRAPSQASSYENTFSKLTTCITSPCRSHEEDPIKQPSSRMGKSRWVWLLQIYSKSFPFIKVDQKGPAVARISVEIQRTSSSQNYYVIVQKNCYFVVEVGASAVSQNSSRTNSIEFEAPCPCCLKGRNSKPQRGPGSKVNSSFNDFHEFTPKFLSSKKKASLVSPQFYNENMTNKKVNVQVLDVADFEEKASAVSDNRTTTLHYKKRIENLDNINATIKSIDLERQNTPNNFRSRPYHYLFAHKERQVQTEQTIPHHFSPQQRHLHPPQQQKHHVFSKRYAPPSHHNIFSKQVKPRQPSQLNPEHKRNIQSNEKGSRETQLSATNIRKFVKLANPPRVVRFHSHSPQRPCALSPLKTQMALQCPTKFTIYS